jgi:hypothetical protein
MGANDGHEEDAWVSRLQYVADQALVVALFAGWRLTIAFRLRHDGR